MLKSIFGFLAGLVPALVFAQVAFPQLPQPVATFYFEDKDWGVEASTSPKRAPYHVPTPTRIPGARVIKTLELKALLESSKDLLAIDVLDSKTRTTIPCAVWMAGAGDGQFFFAEKSRFSAALEKLTAGDKARPIVFLCLSAECWLSYNASLHAVEAGYTDIIWYRGGTNAWTGANFERKKPESLGW